jgi:dTDP-4-amino-4,6-dideoxygalactose transaminase
MSVKYNKALKLISISLSPNTEKDDIRLTLKLLFHPWKWKRGKAIEDFENHFKKYLGTKEAISFNSGRSCLLAILNSLNFEKDNEILVQAFTCNAASNPIKWAGLKPVFVDCDPKNFNIDLEDLKRKITPKSRAVIVQHTFGLPADLDEIISICQENNLVLIEDCAHSLGATYKGQKIGTFGKVSFFSFSRDKIISSVYGGMVCTNDLLLAKRIRQVQDNLDYPSYFWIFQQLLHPILMNYIILPTYMFFGKYLLVVFQKLMIMSKAVHWREKKGQKPAYFPAKLPNSLAEIALHQLLKIDRFNKHRQEIADFYYQELKNSEFELPPKLEDRKQVFLRFTLKHQNAHKIIKKAWQKNILIGDWYTSPVAPHDTNLEKVGYRLGSCPEAEKLARITFNLPTNINTSEKEAQEIVNFLKFFN